MFAFIAGCSVVSLFVCIHRLISGSIVYMDQISSVAPSVVGSVVTDPSFLFLTRVLSLQDVFIQNMFYFVIYQPYPVTISIPPFVHVQYGELYVCLYYDIY